MCLDCAAKVFEPTGWKLPISSPLTKLFPHLCNTDIAKCQNGASHQRSYIKSDLHLKLDTKMTVCAKLCPCGLVSPALQRIKERNSLKRCWSNLKGSNESWWTLARCDLVLFRHHRPESTPDSSLGSSLCIADESLMIMTMSNNNHSAT